MPCVSEQVLLQHHYRGEDPRKAFGNCLLLLGVQRSHASMLAWCLDGKAERAFKPAVRIEHAGTSSRIQTTLGRSIVNEKPDEDHAQRRQEPAKMMNVICPNVGQECAIKSFGP